jgi:hypothetical protein
MSNNVIIRFCFNVSIGILLWNRIYAIFSVLSPMFVIVSVSSFGIAGIFFIEISIVVILFCDSMFISGIIVIFMYSHVVRYIPVFISIICPRFIFVYFCSILALKFISILLRYVLFGFGLFLASFVSIIIDVFISSFLMILFNIMIFGSLGLSYDVVYCYLFYFPYEPKFSLSLSLGLLLSFSFSSLLFIFKSDFSSGMLNNPSSGFFSSSWFVDCVIIMFGFVWNINCAILSVS